MNAPQRRGWCPSALTPMPTGDGLLMRLHPPMGRLSLDQAQALAVAALRHGNGMIDLTSRANLQVRGLSLPSHQAMLPGLVQAGLLGPLDDAAMLAELPCTLLSSPLAGHDGARSGLWALRLALETRLRAETRLANLPPKFCIVLDEADAPLFDDIPAHVRVKISTSGQVAIRGQHGSCVIDLAKAPDQVVTQVVTMALAALHEPAAKGMLHAAPGQVAPVTSGFDPERRLGAFTYAGTLHAGFGVAFGSLQARDLSTLVNAARAAGAKALQVTPWQMLLMLELETAALPALLETAFACGLIVAQGDPRRALSACPGKPACASAHQPVRRDALKLARLMAPALVNMHVHLSGCAKFCARNQHAGPILLAQPEGYSLVGHDLAMTPYKSLELTAAALKAGQLH